MGKVSRSQSKSRQSSKSAYKSNSPTSNSHKTKDKFGKGPNIAIIGGGTRCYDLLEMFAHDRFKHLKAKIVAVADVNSEAPGFVLAKEQVTKISLKCAQDSSSGPEASDGMSRELAG